MRNGRGVYVAADDRRRVDDDVSFALCIYVLGRVVGVVCGLLLVTTVEFENSFVRIAIQFFFFFKFAFICTRVFFLVLKFLS